MVKQKLAKIGYHIKKYGIGRTIQKILFRIFRCDEKKKKAEQKIYQNWILQNEPKEEELQAQRTVKFAYQPKISIVVPMYDTDKNFFLELLNSLLAQTYTNWELCLADGSKQKNETIFAMCSRFGKIKYQFLGENGGISKNTNRALEMAEGDFIAFLDHDDCLPPFCLYEVVKAINENPNVEFLYSDEDKMDEKGKRFLPYFKPDFAPETLECHNYMTHLVVVKKNLVDKIGLLNSQFDGAQDFDFVLRATEATKQIVHIPKILYHWRAHAKSTAYVADTKQYAYVAGQKVVEEHLKRIGKVGTVANPGEVPGVYQIKYEIKANPKVSILILNKEECHLLKRCLTSILTLTSYSNYEICILDNHSKEPKTIAFYEKIKNYPNIQIRRAQSTEKSVSQIINAGIQEADSDFVVQLSRYLKIVTPDWLENAIGYAQNPEIGAVGARIYASNKAIWHAGMAYGISGTAENLLVGLPYGKHDDFGREAATRNVSAVSGACLVARREIYEEVGFLDETLFPNDLQDVDFCLKLLEKGYRVVYNPYVELIWAKAQMKKQEYSTEEENFQTKWSHFLEKSDPYYSPYFSKNNGNFVIKTKGQAND